MQPERAEKSVLCESLETRRAISASEVGHRVKIHSNISRIFPCVRVSCTEPAAAPRSEQSDPEAVVRLEAGSKNINLLYYSCTRKTISATGTHKVFVHVFSRLRRRASLDTRVHCALNAIAAL